MAIAKCFVTTKRSTKLKWGLNQQQHAQKYHCFLTYNYGKLQADGIYDNHERVKRIKLALDEKGHHHYNIYMYL